MSEQAYYFVNHTRKEFCFFTKHISICKSLADALTNNIGWSVSDDIRIDCEGFQETRCLEKMDDLRYTMAKIR
jgi:hypothetical protein